MFSNPLLYYSQYELIANECRFHDHQMIHSRKDVMGTEMLSVPFRREELEMILEDLIA